MTEIPAELIKVMDATPGNIVNLIDPRTKNKYVLMPFEMYEDMRTLIGDDELDGIDIGKLVEDVMREDDANDPWLDSYKKYLDHKDNCEG